MEKCDICGTKVQETFLNKKIGTYIFDEKNKRKLVCFECQKKFKTKEDMLKNIK
jgi:hypothetical protein